MSMWSSTGSTGVRPKFHLARHDTTRHDMLAQGDLLCTASRVVSNCVEGLLAVVDIRAVARGVVASGGTFGWLALLLSIHTF